MLTSRWRCASPGILVMASPPPSTEPEILRTAAGLLRRHGLARGEFMDHDGHICSSAALAMAAHSGIAANDSDLWERQAQARHRTQVFFADFLGTDYLPSWSDRAPDGDYVAEQMEKAAARWEEANGSFTAAHEEVW